MYVCASCSLLAFCLIWTNVLVHKVNKSAFQKSGAYVHTRSAYLCHCVPWQCSAVKEFGFHVFRDKVLSLSACYPLVALFVTGNVMLGISCRCWILVMAWCGCEMSRASDLILNHHHSCMHAWLRPARQRRPRELRASGLMMPWASHPSSRKHCITSPCSLLPTVSVDMRDVGWRLERRTDDDDTWNILSRDSACCRLICTQFTISLHWILSLTLSVPVIIQYYSSNSTVFSFKS